jgi:hypothetical protein
LPKGCTNKEAILKVSDEHSVTILPKWELIDAKRAAIRYNKERYESLLIRVTVSVFGYSIQIHSIKIIVQHSFERKNPGRLSTWNKTGDNRIRRRSK